MKGYLRLIKKLCRNKFDYLENINTTFKLIEYIDFLKYSIVKIHQNKNYYQPMFKYFLLI